MGKRASREGLNQGGRVRGKGDEAARFSHALLDDQVSRARATGGGRKGGQRGREEGGREAQREESPRLSAHKCHQLLDGKDWYSQSRRSRWGYGGGCFKVGGGKKC